VHLRDPLVASLVILASSHHLSTRVLVTFSRTSTDEPLISGGTSGVTQVNGPGSVGGCSEAVKSPCRLSIFAPRSTTWWCGAISACALAVAMAAAVAGRSRDGSVVLLALGCLAVGFLMLGHGLVTPVIGGRPGNQ
jgi:hypothetical protein